MNAKRMLLCAALLSAGLGAGTSALAAPPDWAPAHGYRAKHAPEAREHRYVYYPAQQVYYAPETRSWFWINGGAWQVGLNLPSQIHVAINGGGGVPVMLPTERPYVEHAYVEEHYGRPWREKHRHGRGREDRHERRDRDDHDRSRHRD